MMTSSIFIKHLQQQKKNYIYHTAQADTGRSETLRPSMYIAKIKKCFKIRRKK